MKEVNEETPIEYDNITPNEKDLFFGIKKEKEELDNKAPVIISLSEIPKYSHVYVLIHPFIYHGYRIHHSLQDSFFSIFKLHNETLNIWTHLLPFFAFTFMFIYEILNEKAIFKNWGLIYLYIFTSITLFLFSSIHHTFSCHSNDTWHCCYKLDLTGIMFELIAATICSIHFMFHEFDTLRRYYIIIFLCIGVVAVAFSLFDFFVSSKLNLFLMFLYAILFVLSFLTSIHWVIIGNIHEVEVLSKYILLGFGFMVIGFCIFLAKFPECIFQNKYVDFFFQSHVIWHLCCLGCVICYYLLLVNYNEFISNNKIKKTF